MPRLTPSDVHVDVALTSLSIAFFQETDDFVSQRAFLSVPSAMKSNKYYVYDREHQLRARTKKRSARTRAPLGGMKLSTDLFNAEVWAYAEDISDDVRSNADAALNLENDSTMNVTHQMALRRELEWFSNFFTTGVWATDFTGVGAAPGAGQFLQWDQANSTPVADIKVGRRTAQRLTGKRMNVGVVDPDTFDILTEHPDVLDKIKHTQRGVVDAELLAALLGLDEILVAEGVVNTEPDESTTDGTDFIVGTNGFLLLHRPSAPGLRVPAAGYTFVWSGLVGADGEGVRILNWRDEPIHSDIIEGEISFDHKVVAAELGVFFATAIS